MKGYIYLLILFLGISLQAQDGESLNPSSSSISESENELEKSFLKRFSFDQFKMEEQNLALGYKSYNRNYIYYESDKIHFQFGAGLVHQKSYLNHLEPDVQLGIDALFEYSLNKTFSLYNFGRYVSKSFTNDSQKTTYLLDPFFLKSEIGAGIRGNFNNFQINLGTRTTLDSHLNQAGPQTRINSSFSLDF
ncbi:hypothetical protein RM549_14425 [Salegentibacter sp. F188]|uniref:DUF481 domain-containing protein n=1 Tax=Autumnicola patrickiae TaxID=3075591 RepID=A0ABU3E5R7_9FLAO|nr:hypothetical protein [Salegentibacter sp. F188]MDT0690989.1 hypothetical protein [Salegentibacter sp. F188]